jgi:hypothetical protein
MNSSDVSRANDIVAVAIEEHLRRLQADGVGKLVIDKSKDGTRLTFGNVTVCAENYDIALVRLAGALLDDGNIGGVFLDLLRSGNVPRCIRTNQS